MSSEILIAVALVALFVVVVVILVQYRRALEHRRRWR